MSICVQCLADQQFVAYADYLQHVHSSFLVLRFQQ
jgi:hypothetical protein